MAKTNASQTFITRPLLPPLENIQRIMTDIWDEQWLTNNGKQHQRLEDKLSEYLKGNLTLFANGTLALILGIKALELSGEVITTPFTFPATVQALDWNGLTPVFCDIDPITLNIDPDKIESLITDRTTAILGVHVYGNPCNVNAIQEIADRYKLKVIYDAAHAFGSTLNGKPISSFGDMTMFSFHATKLFHTVEGGAIVTSNDSIIEKLLLLKNFGITDTNEVLLSGMNAKMNEIQAAIGLEVLKLVQEERMKRHLIKKIYEKELAKSIGIRVLTDKEGTDCSYQYFVIEIDEEAFGWSRDFVHDELMKINILTRKYFSPLCSNFPWYSHLPTSKKEHLPVANSKVNNVLALPFYGDLSHETVKLICRTINDLQRNMNIQ